MKRLNSRNKINSVLAFFFNKGTLISNSRRVKKVICCHLLNHFSPIHQLRIFKKQDLDFLLSSVPLVQCSFATKSLYYISAKSSHPWIWCWWLFWFVLILTGIKKEDPVQLSESTFQCDWAASF